VLSVQAAFFRSASAVEIPFASALTAETRCRSNQWPVEQIVALPATAIFLGLFAAGIVDEEAAHELACGEAESASGPP
jgi:hypothetical protein